MRDLAHDDQVVEAEGQQVERDGHGALEGVLDGHEPELRVAVAHGLHALADRRVREGVESAAGQVRPGGPPR